MMIADGRKTILLVEDEAIIAMAEKISLEKFGYRVLAVHRGEDAVTTVATTPGIDLILMDIDLGKGIDGTEAAELILKKRDLPVVFLSSHMEPEIVEKTERITSYGYVVKNSSSTVLEASIKMAFKLFEAQVKEKEKEEALVRSYDLITKLARLVPGVIYQYRLDPDGRSAFPYASTGMNDIYEVTPEDVRMDATPVFGRLHPDDYDMVAGAIQASARSLQTFYCEFRVILPRQGLRWRWSQAHPERLADGGTLWHGIILDITERKQAEDALRLSEAKQADALQMTKAGLWEYDVDRDLFTFNDNFYRIFRTTAAREGGYQMSSAEYARRFCHPDDAAQVGEETRAAIASADPNYSRKIEHRILYADGEVGYIAVRFFIVKDAQGRTIKTYGVNQDISERKRAERILQESNERYENFIAQSTDGVYRLEMDVPMAVDLPIEEQIDYMYHHLRIAECNPTFLAMYGLRDATEILGKTQADLHGGTDNAANREALRRFIAAGYRTHHAVTEEIDVRGNRKYFSNNAIGIVRDGFLLRQWGTQADISGQRRAEDERQVLGEIAQGVLAAGDLREFLAIVHAAVAKIIPAENFFVALFNNESGMFEEAYIADKYDPSFPPSRLEKSLSRHVFLSGRPLLLTNQGQFAALEATGKFELIGTRSPSWLGVPLVAGGDTIGVMVIQDYEQENRYTKQDLELFVSIAEQVALAVEHKRTTEEVKRQLEEKNVLLKEVHHRIKNNFASVSGMLALQAQAAGPEAAAALQQAIGRIDSIRLLYDKLLLGGGFQEASAKSYVENLAALVISLFPGQAKVKLNLDVDDFKLDPKQLFPLGIIINELLTNVMKYAFIEKKSGLIKLSLVKENNRVTLVIQDNGVGFAENVAGSGSHGFGLTLVRMLSQQLGGSFSMEKQAGTRCVVEFNI